MKKFFKLKLIALFLCAAVLVPMTFACGKSGDTGSTTAADSTANSSSDTTPAPTTPPTTPALTEPPTTTEAPTYPTVDPSLPYWDQVTKELANHGLTGGVQILPGTDEADLMKQIGVGACTKAELDVSKDNVPFTSAISLTVSSDPANWWEIDCKTPLVKDVPVEQDGLIVGVLWVKGTRNPGSTLRADDDPPEYYLALKTPTDNWGSEGEMTPLGNQFPTDKWQKVWFQGRILNEETQSSTVIFEIFLGFGFQEIDIGGLTAYYYPSTPDNEKNVLTLVY